VAATDLFAVYSCSACFVAGEPGGGGICVMSRADAPPGVAEVQMEWGRAAPVCAGGGRLLV